ncbi:MAG: methyltransferase domain-containing protein [Fibrobacterota bacterium]|nr:methyltransferase domain-containing protein [Fibrobacterota bacterium]
MYSHFIIAGTRFPLVNQDLVLAGTTVNLATVPYTPAELDRIVAIRGLKERAWPYWLEDWLATYALAEVLDEEDPARWPGPVLDVGCGSGGLSTWLRIRFGLEPFSCDFNSDACRMAALNIARNGAYATKGRVFCADFRSFPAKAEFGLVLAGDMLYAQENQAPILAFLSRHLAPDGTAFLADPGRSAAEGFSLFAAAEGFKVETRKVLVQPGNRNVQVYKLRRHPKIARAGG